MTNQKSPIVSLSWVGRREVTDLYGVVPQSARDSSSEALLWSLCCCCVSIQGWDRWQQMKTDSLASQSSRSTTWTFSLALLHWRSWGLWLERNQPTFGFQIVKHYVTGQCIAMQSSPQWLTRQIQTGENCYIDWSWLKDRFCVNLNGLLWCSARPTHHHA